MASISLPMEKLHKCITDSWKIINQELKNYSKNVNVAVVEHISCIVAHKTTLLKVSEVSIDETNLYGKAKLGLLLQYAIKKEIFSEYSALRRILNSMQTSFNNIMVQLDKIFNVYKSCSLSIEELTQGNETSLSFAEMLEALDRFRRFFCDDHDGRKYSIEYFSSTEDVKKVSKFWDISNLLSLEEELHQILATA